MLAPRQSDVPRESGRRKHRRNGVKRALWVVMYCAVGVAAFWPSPLKVLAFIAVMTAAEIAIRRIELSGD
jgi:fatty acid desaturase